MIAAFRTFQELPGDPLPAFVIAAMWLVFERPLLTRLPHSLRIRSFNFIIASRRSFSCVKLTGFSSTAFIDQVNLSAGFRLGNDAPAFLEAV